MQRSLSHDHIRNYQTFAPHCPRLQHALSNDAPPKSPFHGGVLTLNAGAVQESRHLSLCNLRAAYKSCRGRQQPTWVWLDGTLPETVVRFLHELVPQRELVDDLMAGGRARGGRLKDGGTWFGGGMPIDGTWCRVVVIEVRVENCVVSVWGGERWRNHVRRGFGEGGVHTMVCGVVEMYFVEVEKIGGILDALERDVVEECEDGGFVQRVIAVRKAAGSVRRGAWGWRGALMGCAGGERMGLVVDLVEGYREVGHALLELHLAGRNNRMQEVMQTLAVVTTIFVPLTFLAGIEGMNFQNQPELRGKWSYGAFWVVVGIVVVAQVVFFRKKGWI